MKSFIVRVVVSALIGGGRAFYLRCDGFRGDLAREFYLGFGIAAAIFVVLIPFIKWYFRHRAYLARKAKAAAMQAEWDVIEKSCKETGDYPVIVLNETWVTKGTKVYYHSKAHMFADENFEFDGVDGKLAELPADRFYETAPKKQDWYYYGEVDLVITSDGAIVVFPGGEIAELEQDEMRTFLPEYGGFVVRGSTKQFEPSFAFAVPNGIIPCELLKGVIKKWRKFVGA